MVILPKNRTTNKTGFISLVQPEIPYAISFIHSGIMLVKKLIFCLNLGKINNQLMRMVGKLGGYDPYTYPLVDFIRSRGFIFDPEKISLP